MKEDLENEKEDILLENQENQENQENSMNNVLQNNNEINKGYKKNASSFLTLCFSVIPGCGQMYLGLMRRGLMLMTIFFGCSYITMELAEPLVFISVIIWAYSFFDTFACKNKINQNIEVKDDISEVKEFVLKNKFIILASIILLTLIDVVDRLKEVFNFYDETLIKGGIVVLIVFLGIYIVLFKGNKKEN